MKTILKRMTAMLLSLSVILSASFTVTVTAAGQPTSYSTYSNSGERDVVCTSLDGTNADYYYTGLYTYDKLSEQSGSSLLSSLRTLMRSTHKDISSYDDCRELAVRTDCENNDGRVLLLYTSYSATKSQWNGWNREHVWPQSLGGGNTSGGGADLHHIRPSDASVNSTRGNHKYGEVTNGSAKYGNNPANGYLGGYLGGGYFEPLDNVKGDVARICLYVYVRWGSNWGADSITEVFQSVDVLLEWCELDPVDTWEMGRNEVVESIQGNRNVFIDYPELAWTLFDREAPSDMQTPSGEAMNSGSSSSCPHENTEVRGATSPTYTSQGYTGDTHCADCGKLLSRGETIPVKVCAHNSTEVRGARPATTTATGYTGDTYCLTCGKLISRGKTIPMIVVPDTPEALDERRGDNREMLNDKRAERKAA